MKQLGRVEFRRSIARFHSIEIRLDAGRYEFKRLRAFERDVDSAEELLVLESASQIVQV